MSTYFMDLGRKVKKLSGKPFKSNLKVNTIKGVINHPVNGKIAYTFEEDDSCVEVTRCNILPTV